jgi:hypothetical protein
VSLGVVGFGSQCLGIVENGLLEPALPVKDCSQVIVSFGIVIDGLGDLPLILKLRT